LKPVDTVSAMTVSFSLGSQVGGFLGLGKYGPVTGPRSISMSRAQGSNRKLMSASSSSLESLIHSLIPQSRNDQVVFNDLVAHCNDVLSRLATSFILSTLRLTHRNPQPHRSKSRKGYRSPGRPCQASPYAYDFFLLRFYLMYASVCQLRRVVLTVFHPYNSQICYLDYWNRCLCPWYMRNLSLSMCTASSIAQI
jgi:hypothetical protein